MGTIGTRTAGVFAAGMTAGILFAGDAQAQDLSLETLKRELDLVWMLVAAGLVLLMQVGFLLLEAGMVRSKNSINVAQKNLLDMAFSAAAFALVGFMLAFGPGTIWGSGWSWDFFALSNLTAWETGFFVFQVMFCATAATIVSGAVAERMRLSAYLIATVFLALLVYPVFVHWAWGGALHDSDSAFLGNAGFIDFAGSTVVHATGGWMALAACLVLGARRGRFDANGRPVRIAGHSPVLTASGALLLFVGWIGFNGGSTTAATPEIGGIIANTVLAAATGGITGYLIGWYNDGVIFPENAISGMIGGLVGITAGCAVVTPVGALAIGVIGGGVAVIGNRWLEQRLGIDDAVGAIGVHAFAGAAGTIALVFLAPVDLLPAGTRLAQLAVQGTGVAINFIWSFGLGYIFFLVLSGFVSLRVTQAEEEIGLNEAEHGTRLGVGHVEQALGQLVSGNADLGMRLTPANGDESETLSVLFNRLMDNIEAEESARRKNAERIRDQEEEERLSAMANATFEAIWILRDGVIVDGNRKLEELLGTPLQALRGRRAIDLVSPRTTALVKAEMQRPLVEPYEAEIVDSQGQTIPVELRGREIKYRGETARVGCIVDLRERKNAESRIRHLALHDPLTGLPNRTLFNERLERLIETSKGDTLNAVLLVDLDRFKDINDIYGHPAGDAVIKTVAARLLSLTGPSDTVSRLGGDEFAVIARGLALTNQASDLAYRIVTELSKPIDIGTGQPVRSGASVGVALHPRDAVSLEKLISRADIALYEAKKSGRGAYFMFEPGMDELNERRLRIESDLDGAVDRDEFELYFQPRVDLDSCRAISYEALIRWFHPERGMISPGDFIPVAEESGKIIKLGEWVLRRACEAAMTRLPHANISVNVSPVQFRQKNFVEMVAEVIAETGIDPSRLELEITEGVLIDDDRRAKRILNDLKELGVTVALDDFGTGYSSLSYLGSFPFDTIKIDQSFVRELTTSENARAIIRTIVGLGKGLNMHVVAEGVEKVEEARLLAEIGCRELQGFLLGRPAPLNDLAALDGGTVSEIMAGLPNSLAEQLRQPSRTWQREEPRRAVGAS